MLALWMLMEQEASTRREETTETYESLLKAIAADDVSALESLYLASKSAVYGFALSLLKNPGHAEDIMQETYIRILQSARSYKPQGKPMAWILTIVRNLSLMKLRESSRVLEAEDMEWALPVQDDFTEASTDRMVLRKAAECLADEEWRIVMLHSVSGLKHREIAELLEIPLSTTLSKYRRALIKLEKALEEVMS